MVHLRLLFIPRLLVALHCPFIPLHVPPVGLMLLLLLLVLDHVEDVDDGDES